MWKFEFPNQKYIYTKNKRTFLFQIIINNIEQLILLTIEIRVEGVC
jgi:hypothetical protein